MYVRTKVGVSRGSSIRLIFKYIVEFSALILVVLFVFRENAWGESYANFKFLRRSHIQKFITSLFVDKIE